MVVLSPYDILWQSTSHQYTLDQCSNFRLYCNTQIVNAAVTYRDIIKHTATVSVVTSTQCEHLDKSTSIFYFMYRHLNKSIPGKFTHSKVKSNHHLMVKEKHTN